MTARRVSALSIILAGGSDADRSLDASALSLVSTDPELRELAKSDEMGAYKQALLQAQQILTGSSRSAR